MNSYVDSFAIILARGGSKTIPHKNCKSIFNTNCLELTIKSLQTILPTRNILISSDSEVILKIAKDLGTLTLLRPKELSSDIATSEAGWTHAINYLEDIKIKPSIIIAPQVTSPLRYKKTFEEALNKFVNNNYDSLFSAMEVSNHVFEWSVEPNKKNMRPLSYDPFKQRNRRQDHTDSLDIRVRENGSFFIFKREGFITHKNRIFGNVGYYIQDKLESIEIDDALDWVIAEAVLTLNQKLFIY